MSAENLDAEVYAERARMCLAEVEHPIMRVFVEDGLVRYMHSMGPNPELVWRIGCAIQYPAARCLACQSAFNVRSKDPSPDGCWLPGMGLRDCGRTDR